MAGRYAAILMSVFATIRLTTSSSACKFAIFTANNKTTRSLRATFHHRTFGNRAAKNSNLGTAICSSSFCFLIGSRALLCSCRIYARFFRLKILPLRECPVPDSVESGKGTKLRNSLIYRDASAPVIWLRPRGLNFINIQLMVAALKLSPDGKRIAEAEIRFSSGVPLAMGGLFVSTAYSTFASIEPALVTAVLFLVFGAIGLRTIRSRMETLIKNAVSELEQM